jgi:ornithine cyclodeaminase
MTVMQSSTLLISDREIHELLPMRECIDVMQQALESVAQGTSVLPLRTVLRLAGTNNAFATMPAVHGMGVDAAIGAKVITVFPGNDATPFDSHIGVVLLFDAQHGALLAILDASSITAIRTSAVSGLATRLLANPDADEVALLGAGVLALPHLDAMCAVRPIRRVRVWSRNQARAEAFAAKARTRHDVDVRVCASARDAVTDAPIVCTITSSRTPVLSGSWLAAGTHVNAVGASIPTARELDADAVRRSLLFADRRESVLAEAGDFLMARSEGVVDDSHIRGEIGELSLGRCAGRTSVNDITLFKSLGLAVEDVATAQYVHGKARERGLGTTVSLGGMRAE